MLKATLLAGCLLLAASSYNAQNAIQSANQENFPFYSPFVQPIHHHQYYGMDNEDGEGNRSNNPIGTISNQQSTVSRLGKLTWPTIGRPRPVTNTPNEGANLSELVSKNKQLSGTNSSLWGQMVGIVQGIVRAFLNTVSNFIQLRPLDPDPNRPPPTPPRPPPNLPNWLRDLIEWLRRILYPPCSPRSDGMHNIFGGLFRQLCPDTTVFTTTTTTTTATETSTDTSTSTYSCTISTTACAQKRHRRDAIALTTTYTTNGQLERETSSFITLV